MVLEQNFQLQDPSVERRVAGKGFAIDYLGTLPESNTVVITLPGVGDVAALHFTNLTQRLEEKPLGLAISYLQEFDPEKLVEGLVKALIDLADSNGQINLVIHACSYGASLLPRLTEALAAHKNITIKGIIARAPLFDVATFTERFQNYRAKNKLVLAFSLGMKELFDSGEITNPENFASLSELFAQLPESIDPKFIPLLQSENIPLRTILFSKDQIINKDVVGEILGSQIKYTDAESGGDRLGHHPMDMESFKASEQKLLVDLLTADQHYTPI